MVDRSSVKYISGLLNDPDAITDTDQGSIARFRESFPYFIPVRYIAAKESNKQQPFSTQMMSEIQPYLGDWILFCDFLNAGNKDRSRDSMQEADEQEPEMLTDSVVQPVTDEAAIEIIIEVEEQPEAVTEVVEEDIIMPVYTQDYFLQLGERVSEEIPAEIDDLIEKDDTAEEAKSLMVMMSFSEWLLHFKNTDQREQEEKKDQKALKTMWQKEKLAAAMEEENEEIPEEVFEMAVNSIAKEEGLASETLAEIYIKQGKYDQAIEMYRKLSLRNPQKSAYFARKIEEALKEK